MKLETEQEDREFERNQHQRQLERITGQAHVLNLTAADLRT
jgi:hypothetical protein